MPGIGIPFSGSIWKNRLPDFGIGDLLKFNNKGVKPIEKKSKMIYNDYS